MARPEKPEIGELSTQTGGDASGQPVAPAAAAALPGFIDRYRIERLLGAGGMGVVYAGQDPELARPVAIKLIRTQPGGSDASGPATRRLLREAQAMARIRHPNVVTVYDVGVVDDQQVFVAMERIDGVTLGDWLELRRRSLAEILRVFTDAARGLAAAHAAGLVHRDFKPDNVMVGRDGHVYVLDFGLARPADRIVDEADARSALALATATGVTLTHGIAGTPLYMAPEQFAPEGGVDHRVDQFALCVALYRALYKRHPFSDDSFELLKQAVTSGDLRPPPPGTRVPGHIDAALRRGMSADRERRFADVTSLVAALAPPRRWWHRPGVVAALALVAVAAVAAVALITVGKRKVAAPAPARVRPTVGARQLTFLGSAENAAYSPDGRQLAVLAGDGVHVTDLATGQDRLLASGNFRWMVDWLPGALLTLDPSFHPMRVGLADGAATRLFGDEVSYNFVAPIEGGRALAGASTVQDGFARVGLDGAEGHEAPGACHLGPTGGAALRARALGASPPGDRVVVAMGASGSGSGPSSVSLWTARTDCSEPHLVAADVGRTDWVFGLRWIHRPDGDALYVLLSGAQDTATLLRLPVTADGRARGPLETLATGLDAVNGPSVSPTGEVAFLRMDQSSNLYWYHRSPEARVGLTGDTARRSLPTLSHDGQYVAFEEGVGPRDRLVVMHLPDGRERASFPFDRGDKVWRIAWSPDDHELLASQRREAGDGRLTIFSLDGAPPRDLQDGLYSAFVGTVDWAADGRLLVPTWDGQGAFWWNLDGHSEGALAREPYVGLMMHTTVSGDGALVAAWWMREPTGIYLISAWTGEARLLVPGKATDIGKPLAFSPGDEYLYFQRSSTVPEDDAAQAWIERVRIADGKIEAFWRKPSDEDEGEVALRPDGEVAVGTVALGRRDIWTVDPG